MKLTDAQRLGFAAFAQQAYGAGVNATGHLLSAVAAKTDVPDAQYQRALAAVGEMAIVSAVVQEGLRRKRNPGRRRARARARPRARASSPRAFKATPRRYFAAFKIGRARKRVEFNAHNDAAAVRYATGLLRHKTGGVCVSVQPLPGSKKK